MNNYLLIIGSSARILAQSANRAGYRPLVIDLFADLDTRAVAVTWRKVASLAVDETRPVISDFMDSFHVSDAVYGSGLEAFPETLRLLNERLNVIGNSSNTVRRIVNKNDFFPCLEYLDIPYPQVRFKPPAKTEQWLVKPFAGAGGVGIRPCSANDQDKKKQTYVYWQRQIKGVSMSVLFLADGRRAQIIGFSRQWTRPGSFEFAGIIKHRDLPEDIRLLIQLWLIRLVPEFALVGLNSLDFIIDNKQCLILEINPRPSVSMILYEAEFTSGLLYEHVNACMGTMIFDRQPTTEIVAMQILYATETLCVPAGYDWPDWSMDRPVGPCMIQQNQPICSIIAAASDAQYVIQQILKKQQLIFNSI